ncbi:Similar to ACAA2: 3-ketoacyl-CoA thiolase [Cotesia congregata]|uniref:Mitochondrial (Homo sapiens) n=1 Tax=Cotesia congregata TaxID=51543 RepID=A0A8J2H8L5_COTCN|nr:Similar to ACAA2: 3-ketoacyl-CoA thiolase [Cotesia congregata]
MSQTPFVVRNVRFGTMLGQKIDFEDALWVGLADSYCNLPMGGTAEKLGAKYGVTREEVDQFALRSQQRWKAANDAGYFKAEMAPVSMTIKKKQIEVSVDEHPRPQTTIEDLKKLPEEAIKKHNLKPLARLYGYTTVGVDPSIMGIGPAPAIKHLLKLSKKTLNDLELVEINEAFGAQTLACVKDLGLDINKLNVNGGAIALGHPLGASGSRITAHIIHELRRRNASKFAIGAACIGGGQGIALLIEAL